MRILKSKFIRKFKLSLLMKNAWRYFKLGERTEENWKLVLKRAWNLMKKAIENMLEEVKDVIGFISEENMKFTIKNTFTALDLKDSHSLQFK